MTPTPFLIYGKRGVFHLLYTSLRHHNSLWLVATRRLLQASSLALAILLALLSLPTRSLAQTATAAPGPDGVWEGTLSAGAANLHLFLTLTKSGSAYTGQLNSVDQGANLTVDNGSFNGDTLRFEVPSVGGVYEGTLNKAGTELTGTWTQRGVSPLPLTFKRTTSAAEPAPSAKPSTVHTPKPGMVPLDIVVPIAPTAFKAGGKWHLVYELHVTNLGKWDCLLTRIDVMNGDGGAAAKPLANLSGTDLDKMIVRTSQEVAQNAKIAPGAFAIVYMWITSERLDDVPAKITHRIAAKIGDYPEGLTLDGVPVTVDRKPVVVIAPPLAGSDWSAGNGPSNTSQHRRAFIPLNGHAWISQRFAIDWVEANADGKTFQGDSADNKNYRAYGAEIHAVADGVVTQTKDGIPQNIPNQPPIVPITLETVGGNHVIMEIGDGLYAFYAHMQPGSVRVKVGDKVHRGQVLGLLGNSGNSSEPHLHFHICNRNSELACEGLPYAFASYEFEGKGDGWKPSDSHGAPEKHEMEIPLEDEVVRFPAQP
jgi:peptidase M23-like protein